MSDISQGPDSWLATDGVSYPPGSAAEPPRLPHSEVLAVQKSVRRWGCFVPLVVVGIIVLAIIVFVIIAVVNFSNSDFLGGLNFDKTLGCTSNPPTYPGRQSTDCVATATTPNPIGIGIGIGGAFVTATWTRSTENSGTATICAAVSIANLHSSTIGYDEHYWSLQTPAGTVANANLADTGSLGSGQIMPGGSASSSVCFDDPGPQTGTYVGIYKDPVNPVRGIWLVPLT
jgi:hypothetical protein